MEQFRRRRSQVGLLCSAFLADGCLLPPVLALRHLRGCRFFSFFPAGGRSLRSFVFRVFVCFCRPRRGRGRSLACAPLASRAPSASRMSRALLASRFASLACSRARRALRRRPRAIRFADVTRPCVLRACFARFALRFAPHIRRGRRRRAGGRKRRTPRPPPRRICSTPLRRRRCRRRRRARRYRAALRRRWAALRRLAGYPPCPPRPLSRRGVSAPVARGTPPAGRRTPRAAAAYGDPLATFARFLGITPPPFTPRPSFSRGGGRAPVARGTPPAGRRTPRAAAAYGDPLATFAHFGVSRCASPAVPRSPSVARFSRLPSVAAGLRPSKPLHSLRSLAA